MNSMNTWRRTSYYHKIRELFSYEDNSAQCYIKLGHNIYQVFLPIEDTLSYGLVPNIDHNGRPKFIKAINKVIIEGVSRESKAYFEWNKVSKWFYHKNRNILSMKGNYTTISQNLEDLVPELDGHKVDYKPIHKHRNDITTSFID